MIPLRQNWTRQPQVPVTANPYWVSRGLRFLWSGAHPHVNSLREVSSVASITGSPTVVIGNSGLASHVNSSNYYSFNGETSVGRIKATGEISVIVIKKIPISGFWPNSCIITDGGSVELIAIQQDSTYVYWQVRDSSPGFSFPGLADFSYTLNTDFAFGLAWRDGVSNGCRTFVDGRFRTQSTVTAFTDDGTVSLGLKNSGGAFFNEIYLWAIFDRALSDAQMIELCNTRRVWQLFQPITRRLYFDVAAAAPTLWAQSAL